MQWITDYYPQGKTSVSSRFNVPGRVAWAAMETPGFVVVLYCMLTIPSNEGLEKLPGANWLMAILFVCPHLPEKAITYTCHQAQTIHYTYRALLSPLFLNPAMSPIHPLVAVSATLFQIINGSSIGGYLAGYGPTTLQDWAGTAARIEIGLIIFFAGFVGNIYHDDELREIRRAAARNQKRRAEAHDEKSKEGIPEKVYMIPENGLFRLVLYPHYLCEWVEWCGFWVIGGVGCVPARTFFINEVATMLPRALNGRRWYIRRFGKDKIGEKRAVIPGLV